MHLRITSQGNEDKRKGWNHIWEVVLFIIVVSRSVVSRGFKSSLCNTSTPPTIYSASSCYSGESQICLPWQVNSQGSKFSGLFQ